jgi:hypothetical protein
MQQSRLNDAIVQAKQIDEQSKTAGFYQEALDHVARQGYSNARFEVNSEEGFDLVEEYYTDNVVESEQVQPDTKAKVKSKFNQEKDFVQDIQQGLQGSVRAVN